MRKSRLVLGTAALGMPYGISNDGSQPSRENAFEILDAASSCGINTFDTASVYGDAEAVVGEWISNTKNDVFVISKMRPYVGSAGSDFVVSEIHASLKRLNQKALDGYLVHRASDLQIPEVVAGLRKAQENELVAKVGASVYDEIEAEYALAAGVDCLQVPYNVFDRRFGTREFLEKVLARSVTVFARSPFLQGLLLMDPAQLPDHLREARPFLMQFAAVAKRHGMSQLEAALGFVLAEQRMPHIVVGAVSPAQVNELAAVRSASPALVAEIHELFNDVPPAVTDPRLWNMTQ